MNSNETFGTPLRLYQGRGLPQAVPTVISTIRI
jgi:hypothetical protein